MGTMTLNHAWSDSVVQYVILHLIFLC